MSSFFAIFWVFWLMKVSNSESEFKTLHGKFEEIEFDEKYVDEFNAKFTKKEQKDAERAEKRFLNRQKRNWT